uniref:Uncharacterized protein n=1 Tax=Pyxicephalus adspersus TaxID=30357 RepID=A0AAV3A3P2_PYXAD|nr:TPA: hypothetical protein GDO54_013169 [Pyxicephalus adspersus]
MEVNYKFGLFLLKLSLSTFSKLPIGAPHYIKQPNGMFKTCLTLLGKAETCIYLYVCVYVCLYTNTHRKNKPLLMDFFHQSSSLDCPCLFNFSFILFLLLVSN